MKIGVFLNFVGLGSNLLHLSYCHQIAKKYGPIHIITLCENLKDALDDDPLISDIVVYDKNKKTLFNTFYLSNFLKSLNLDKLFIYYPGKRIYLAAKISGIKDVLNYKNSKKNLHLVKEAKNFTIRTLNLENCPTETNFFISTEKKKIGKKMIDETKFNIVLGIGSSGPTTKWGTNNYVNLINHLNLIGNYYFYLLCGKYENNLSSNIIKNAIKKNCYSLHDMSIKQLIPILSSCNMYVGNDSFGHHITSQLNIPSIILMLDTPRAYTDYSTNQFRILPDGVSIDDINHDSNYHPNKISVEKVINKIKKLRLT